MPKIHLTETEAQELLKNIEANGGDASELKKILQDSAEKRSTASGVSLDDDSWVTEKWNEATPTVGDALTCNICRKPASELRAGICYACFKIWALSCKPKKEKGNKRGNSL